MILRSTGIKNVIAILDTCIDQAKLEEFEEKASELHKKVSNFD